jgi:hypothetical protein
MSFNSYVSGAFTTNSLNVTTSNVTFPSGSISSSALSGLAPIATTGAASNLSGVLAASNIPSLPASTINSGAFSVGAFGTNVAPSVDNTYSMGTSSNRWSNLFSSAASFSNLTATGSITIPSNSLTTDSISGLAAFVSSNAPLASNGGTLSASNIPNLPATKITSGTFSVGSFGTSLTPSIDNAYSLGAASNQWSNVYAAAATLSNVNVSGALTTASHIPSASASYDLGSASSNWRNAYFSGSLTATNYVGLQRKVWNAASLGVASIAGGSYFKLATMLDSGNTSSGGGLRIVGQLGGFGNSQTATVDRAIVTRGNFYVRGSAQGYFSGAKVRADIAVYIESDGKYSVYYYNPAQFSIFDLSVESGLGVTLYEPTSTPTTPTTPTGTLVTSSILSVLTTTSEFSSGTVTTSFNSFGFSNSAVSGNPTWNLIGSSNTGAIDCGIVTSGQHNPATTATYDLGATSSAWRNAYLSGSLSASTYTNLPRKYWNANTQGFWNAAAGSLCKVGTLLAVGNAANGGSVRISGAIGGFGNNQSAIVDCIISSRGAYGVKGYANGYVAGAKAFADIVTYVESTGTFSIYLKVVATFVSWDLSVEGAGTNVTVLEPSNTITTSPSGTLNTSSVLSVLNQTTESSSTTTSFNNFSFASNATDLTWAAQGSSNGGSLYCGPLRATGAAVFDSTISAIKLTTSSNVFQQNTYGVDRVHPILGRSLILPVGHRSRQPGGFFQRFTSLHLGPCHREP